MCKHLATGTIASYLPSAHSYLIAIIMARFIMRTLAVDQLLRTYVHTYVDTTLLLYLLQLLNVEQFFWSVVQTVEV